MSTGEEDYTKRIKAIQDIAPDARFLAYGEDAGSIARPIRVKPDGTLEVELVNFPVLKKVAEVTLEAAATSITIDNLDINAHKFYEIILSLKNAIASGVSISMYINNDQVATNYYEQILRVIDTTINSALYNDANVAYVHANISSFNVIDLIRDIDGYPRAVVRTCRAPPSEMNLILKSYAKADTVTNITRLDFVASAADSLDTGSKVIVMGVVE